MNKNSILEKIKSNIKEVITNVIVDDLVSYGTNLGDIKVIFDERNPLIIHIILPDILENKK